MTKEINFTLGTIDYFLTLIIKKGDKMDPKYRSVILDIRTKSYHAVRYIRFTDGTHSVELRAKIRLKEVNSWKEAKQVILNYLLNETIS